MTLRFDRNHIIIMIILVVMITFSFFLFYHVGLKPMNQKIEVAENQLRNEQKVLDVVRQKLITAKKEALNHSKALQEKIPVKPLLDHFLLNLEKAEVISNSQVTYMTFSEEEMITEKYDDLAQKEEADKQNNEQGSEQQNNIPKGLKRMVISLMVEASDYDELRQFVRTLEDLSRYTIVNSLSFQGVPEILTVEDKVNSLSYEVKISTFYYPELEELVNDLPPLEIPEPGYKTSPLAPGISIQKDETETSMTQVN